MVISFLAGGKVVQPGGQPFQLGPLLGGEAAFPGQGGIIRETDPSKTRERKLWASCTRQVLLSTAAVYRKLFPTDRSARMSPLLTSRPTRVLMGE